MATRVEPSVALLLETQRAVLIWLGPTLFTTPFFNSLRDHDWGRLGMSWSRCHIHRIGNVWSDIVAPELFPYLPLPQRLFSIEQNQTTHPKEFPNNIKSTNAAETATRHYGSNYDDQQSRGSRVLFFWIKVALKEFKNSKTQTTRCYCERRSPVQLGAEKSRNGNSIDAGRHIERQNLRQVHSTSVCGSCQAFLCP